MIVVALDDGTAERAYDLEAFVRTGVVADDIAGAEILFRALVDRIGQNNLKSVEVGMNIT